MNPHKRLVAILGITSLFGATAVLAAAPALADSKCWSYNHYELRFAELINKARYPGAALALDPELSKVAKRHSKRMVAAGRMYHSTVRELRNRVTEWTFIGENVGGPGRSAINFHRAFMRSPHHRLNIMDPGFRYMGIGVKVNSAGMWVTQVFSAPWNPGTRLKMPSCEKKRPHSAPQPRSVKPPERSSPDLISTITRSLLTGLLSLVVPSAR